MVVGPMNPKEASTGGGSTLRERRQTRRIPRRDPARVQLFGDATEHECRLENLSPGGASIRCRPPFPPGSVLRLVVGAPDAAAVRRHLARVVWVHGIPEPGVHDVGVRFVEWCDVFEERRSHARRELKVFVRYRGVSRDAYDRDEQHGMLEDASEAGLGLIVHRPYPPGSELEVQVPKTALGPARTVRAKVVRVQTSTLGRWLVGACLRS